MSRHVLLNNIEHKNLKVRTERSEKFGDNLWFTQTFPKEFRMVQCCYPIFFQKDDTTGKFFPVALFGFEKDENLFLGEDGWNAPYIPLAVLRQPFSIGRQSRNEGGTQKENLVVNVDLDSPRISYEEGRPVFDELGQHTSFLDQVIDSLFALHEGVIDTDQFIDALLELELIEPITLSITLNDGSENELIGFYTINEEKLNSLTADQLFALHKANYLEPIFMVLSSQTHVNFLVQQKNKKLAVE